MGKAYNQMKVFYHTEKLNSLLETKILPPVNIRIKPTNICNHKCWYCAFRLDGEQIGKDMKDSDSIPREKMLELTEDFKEMKIKAVILSGGGEPLCYKYVYEFIDRLTPELAILTNGALLKGEIAKLLAKKACWARVSFDGWDKESYAEYRQVNQDEFGKVCDNIADFKGRSIGAVMVVDKKNYLHIYDMIKLFYCLGMSNVKIAPVIMSGDPAKMNAYHKDLLPEVDAQVESARRDFAFEINNSYHIQMGSFSKAYNWCPYCQITPIIGADCNVYYCHDKAYNLDEGMMGSIKNISFKDFWNASKDKFFKVNPGRDCAHHCMCDQGNKNIIEYLNAKMVDFI